MPCCISGFLCVVDPLRLLAVSEFSVLGLVILSDLERWWIKEGGQRLLNNMLVSIKMILKPEISNWKILDLDTSVCAGQCGQWDWAGWGHFVLVSNLGLVAKQLLWILKGGFSIKS